jgi:hypothetical protein
LMIWSSRNKVIFSNGVKDAVEAIKLITWRWGLSRHKIPTCLYYEWCWDPGLCLWRWSPVRGCGGGFWSICCVVFFVWSYFPSAVYFSISVGVWWG